MITVFARDYGQNIITGQSFYVEADMFGSISGRSYLAGQFDSNLSISADGYTMSTWIKPDWDSGQLGAPVYFTRLAANTGQLINDIWLGYDAETANDGIFIYTNTDYDAVSVEIWYYAPLVDDVYNQAITGLQPGTTGVNGIVNSWNNTSNTGFVHIGATIKDYNTSPATQSGDLSERGTIYWNGQPLRTYEIWTSGNNAWFSLEQFRVNSVRADFGSFIYPRFYWQDRSSIWTDVATDSMIINDYYGNGSPADPVTQATLHYNFEDPNPYVSNGVFSPYTLTPARTTPATFPSLDTNNFV
jgi:hypothetical protein